MPATFHLAAALAQDPAQDQQEMFACIAWVAVAVVALIAFAIHSRRK